MILRSVRLLVAVAALLALPVTAWAAIIVAEANNTGGTDNVISNGCVLNDTDGSDNDVQGCLNSAHTYYVDFASDEPIEFGGGQAVIEAVDGEFDYLKISLASGDTFSKLVLNIFATADGQVQFTSQNGSSGLFDLDGNGENFFTLTGEDFAFIEFKTYNTLVVQVELADEVKQVRLGGLEGPNVPLPVPEPASVLLLGSGLAGLAARRRFARRK